MADLPAGGSDDESIEAAEKDPRKRHTLDRRTVTQVRCLRCHKVQKSQKMCEGCGSCMGAYFCSICNLYDDVEKGQWHCGPQPDGSPGCGICRVGGSDNFFHCGTCGTCLAASMREGHACRASLLGANCPICFELLQTSRTPAMFMTCGHPIHVTCYEELLRAGHARCPVCSKSVRDMSRIWRAMDQECAATPMPEAYRNWWVRALCADCNEESDTRFHVVGLKCGRAGCGSYNTARVGPAKDPHPAQGPAAAAGAVPLGDVAEAAGAVPPAAVAPAAAAATAAAAAAMAPAAVAPAAAAVVADTALPEAIEEDAGAVSASDDEDEEDMAAGDAGGEAAPAAVAFPPFIEVLLAHFEEFLGANATMAAAGFLEAHPEWWPHAQANPDEVIQLLAGIVAPDAYDIEHDNDEPGDEGGAEGGADPGAQADDGPELPGQEGSADE